MTFSKKIHNCIIKIRLKNKDQLALYWGVLGSSRFWEICLLVVKYLRARCMLKSQLILSDLVIPKVIKTCADPGIFVRGVQARRQEKTAWTTVFFFFVLNLFTYFTVYRGGPIVLLRRKLYFSKDPEGVLHFPGGGGGGPTFSRGGGSKC